MSSRDEVTGLSKCYGRHRALTGLSFSVDAGSIYGLIGPNGAGKTTVLSILAGLVSPSSGEASILGIPVRPNHPELTSAVGFATPQLSFFDYLTGAEVLLACGLMQGLQRDEATRRMRDLLRLLDLAPAAGRSATSRRRSSNRCTIGSNRVWPPRPDSHSELSGNPGAVQGHL